MDGAHIVSTFMVCNVKGFKSSLYRDIQASEKGLITKSLNP